MIAPELINLTSLPSVALCNRAILPPVSAIYFCLDADENLLYIGKAANLASRWQQHHRQNQLGAIADVKIAYLTIDAPDLLPEIEAKLIKQFNPSLNRSEVKGGGQIKVRVEIDVPDLGQRIRDARHESGRSITQLAAEADISVANWYAVEQERIKVLPLTTLRRIEQVLGVDFGVEP